jgi:hypothetical protein
MGVVLNLTPWPPLQTGTLFYAEEIFVWRGGIKKEGLAPLLNAPYNKTKEGVFSPPL